MPELFTSFSPGEVIFFGEHSVVYGRKAVACAVNRGIEIRGMRTKGRTLEIRSALGQMSTDLQDQEAIAKASGPLGPVVRFAAAKWVRCGMPGGVKLVIDSDIPEQSGMASSAAVCSALLLLFEGMHGNRPEPADAVRQVHEGEIEIQQRGSVLGSACTVSGGFVKVEGGRWERLNWPVDGCPVAVIDTLERCETRLTTARVRQRFETDRPATEKIFDRMDRLAADGLVALRARDWPVTGSLMNENQECLEQLGVGTDKIARLTERIRPYVYGAKMTGAGGGGCLVCLVRPGQASRLLGEVEAAGCRLLETRLSAEGARCGAEEVSCRL